MEMEKVNYRVVDQNILFKKKIKINLKIKLKINIIRKHLTIPIIIVHNSDIIHYFENYFVFQINLIIFFQTNYFALKL